MARGKDRQQDIGDFDYHIRLEQLGWACCERSFVIGPGNAYLLPVPGWMVSSGLCSSRSFAFVLLLGALVWDAMSMEEQARGGMGTCSHQLAGYVPLLCRIVTGKKDKNGSYNNALDFTP